MQQTGAEDSRIRSLKLRFADIQEKINNHKARLAGTEISPAIVQELTASREALHQFFSQPLYQKSCSNCHDGYCCMNDYGQYLLPHELIYFAAIGYELPIPDWEFLAREAFEAKPWCLFMGSKSCLLKENRRIICLRYYCRGLYKKIKEEKQDFRFNDLNRRLKLANLVFAGEALEKLGPKLDEETRLLLQYYLKD